MRGRRGGGLLGLVLIIRILYSFVLFFVVLGVC